MDLSQKSNFMLKTSITKIPKFSASITASAQNQAHNTKTFHQNQPPNPMYGEKKIAVFKDNDSMGITFNWYTPAAFFFAFFTVFWNAFLAFWYTTTIGANAPTAFMFIPLIHVGVGLYLIYYTLCLFLNRTYIDVGDGYLTVEHRPIPWWRGNKEVLTKDIQQLYVVEKVRQNKNGRTYSYELWANLTQGRKERLMSGNGLTSLELQEIEEYLEEFMGINDLPVRGEYAKKRVLQKQTELPRRQRRDVLASDFRTIYESRKWDYLDFKNESLEIISITQLDWKDGNSDKILQLVDDDDRETLIYIQQNKALLAAFEEKMMSIFETQNIDFSIDKPPTSIFIDGETHLLHDFKEGDQFLPGVYPGMKARQWWYLSRNQQSFVRVIDNQNLLKFYKGKKVTLSDFEKGLDLNNLPQRDKALRKNNLDEKDFV